MMKSQKDICFVGSDVIEKILEEKGKKMRSKYYHQEGHDCVGNLNLPESVLTYYQMRGLKLKDMGKITWEHIKQAFTILRKRREELASPMPLQVLCENVVRDCVGQLSPREIKLPIPKMMLTRLKQKKMGMTVEQYSRDIPNLPSFNSQIFAALLMRHRGMHIVIAPNTACALDEL